MSSLSTKGSTSTSTSNSAMHPKENKTQRHSRPDSSPHATRKHTKHHLSHRSQSPLRDDDGHRHKRRRSRSRSPAPKPVALSYKAKPLSKRHFEEYRPLFQSYLDIQKQIQLDDLDEREVKGRWKSFTSRWNRGDLARSWYDPSMLKTAQETVESFRASSPRPPAKRASPSYATKEGAEDQSDDEFGPAPPTDLARHAGHGPTIPKLDDLTYRNEMREEDRAQDQSSYVNDIRHERKTDRKAQKERLEELVPRADPGSRERQLEKKRETTSTLKSFRDAKESGDVEVAEADLMGDDGIHVYRKKKKEQERQKNEREIRREEIARARDAERDERLAERRAKEGKTMDFLRQLAAERFG
ncbi:hypothetical protein BDW02DRAFT_574794 [Decorospora gaudefroyi]|uniref:Uncharacterized protein n=1 Tax=Decorospora gaudefroyi TaxID=184978 RepID=A0A6A5K1X7_9PLEO|nr:hypothetical protein BDW02DRAFT_574794 [Decorospora gaudefroyi]